MVLLRWAVRQWIAIRKGQCWQTGLRGRRGLLGSAVDLVRTSNHRQSPSVLNTLTNPPYELLTHMLLCNLPCETVSVGSSVKSLYSAMFKFPLWELGISTCSK